jgi:hypothetical protein
MPPSTARGSGLGLLFSLINKVESGPHYTIRDTVRCDGFMDHFTLDSDFGVFEVTGDGALRKLLREIRAIDVLRKIQDSDVFKKPLEEAAQKPLDFGRNQVDDPGRTLEGVSQEIASIFNSAYTAVAPASVAPSILNKSYVITAEVEIPEGGAEGMIVTEGGRFGGYGLFLSKGIEGIGQGHVVFLYNLLDLKRTTWEGPKLSPGKHTIVFDFKSNGPGLGKGGTGVLYVGGKEVARNAMEHTTPILFPEDETFDVGQDTGTALALIEYRYDCPFKFTGKINRLTFDLGPVQYTEEEHKQLPAIAERVRRAKD